MTRSRPVQWIIDWSGVWGAICYLLLILVPLVYALLVRTTILPHSGDAGFYGCIIYMLGMAVLSRIGYEIDARRKEGKYDVR